MQRGFAPIIIILAVLALAGAYFVGATVGKPNLDEWFGIKGFIRDEESLKDLYSTPSPTPSSTSPDANPGGSSPTPAPKTQAIKLTYNLPSGWKTVQDTSGTFEVGYDPTKSENPSVKNLRVELFGTWENNPPKKIGYNFYIDIRPYDGGSRHKFILDPDNIGVDKMGWEKSEYYEKEYTYKQSLSKPEGLYNNWSCLVLYGIYISQGPSTNGMCAISSTQAFRFGIYTDEVTTEQVIQTIKLLKTP